jgi:hypothetical protein
VNPLQTVFFATGAGTTTTVENSEILNIDFSGGDGFIVTGGAQARFLFSRFADNVNIRVRLRTPTISDIPPNLLP